GIGAAGPGPGITVGGACAASWICVAGTPGAGPSGLTCAQAVGPSPETCNGLDDDCDGTVDDHLTDVGGTCGSACPGGLAANCVGHCKAGAITCGGGARVSTGDRRPET